MTISLYSPYSSGEIDAYSSEQQELYAVQVLREILPGVLHELNNPISYLIGNIESLREYITFLSQGARLLLDHPVGLASRVNEPSRVSAWLQSLEHWKEQENVEYLLGDLDEMIGDMVAGTEVCMSLSESLRLYLRKPRMAFASFDLAEVVEHAIHLVQHLGRQRKIEFHRHFSPCEPCWGSPGLICRVLVYLLLNAIEAVQHQAQPRIDIQIAQAQSSLVVTVQDNGSGMTEDEIRVVKNPGVSLWSSSHRTGLGLGMVEQIMLLHQGQLSLQSVPTQKTVVSLLFPGKTPRQQKDAA